MKHILFFLILITISFLPVQSQSGSTADNEAYTRIRLGVHGGFSRRAVQPEETNDATFQNYLEDLGSGPHLGVDVSYFFTKSLGLGLTFSRTIAENQDEVLIRYDTVGIWRKSTLEDEIAIDFVGPSFLHRLYLGNGRGVLLSTLSVGYLLYRKNQSFSDFSNTVTDKILITGGTPGLVVGVGADFEIVKPLYLGVMISGTMGKISEFDRDTSEAAFPFDVPDETTGNISRLDVSFGLRFAL